MTLEGVKRHRSLVADARGRIWVSRTGGLAMTDPARGDSSVMPALSHVEALSADGTAIDLLGSRRVLAGRRRVTIGYAGLSLAVPERVMFQYRLDGFDTDWSRPVAEREAVYTNLAPRPYVFRVRASNGDGLWNEDRSVGSIRDRTERLADRLVSALGPHDLCTRRMGHSSAFASLTCRRNLNRRFEAQLAERTRIAQELHDTLLQGFISASMQLHVASAGLPADSHGQAAIGRVLELMRRVIDEGRNAVRGLRSARTAAHDLELAFAGIRDELAEADDIDYRVIIEGEARPLHPLVRDEVYRIGREALVNAFRHARARSVDLELDYAPNRLRLHVRDDGHGIDPEVASSGDGRALGHRGNARTRGEDRRPNYDQESPRRRHGNRADRAREGRFRSQGNGCGPQLDRTTPRERRRQAVPTERRTMSDPPTHPRVQRGRPSASARRYRRGHKQPGRHGDGGAGIHGPGRAATLSRTSPRRDADGPPTSRHQRHRRDDRDSRRISRGADRHADDLRRRRRDSARARGWRTWVRAEEHAAE